MKKGYLYLIMGLILIGNVFALEENFDDSFLASGLFSIDSGLNMTYADGRVNISGATTSTDYNFFKTTIDDIDSEFIFEVKGSTTSGLTGYGTCILGGNISSPLTIASAFGIVNFCVVGATTDDFAIYFVNQTTGTVMCYDKNSTSWVDIGYLSFGGSACDNDAPFSFNQDYILGLEGDGTRTRGYIKDENGTLIMQSIWVDNVVFDTDDSDYTITAGEWDSDGYYYNYDLDYLFLDTLTESEIIYPNGEELFNVGDLITIDWTQAVGSINVSYDIDYSDDSGSNWNIVENDINSLIKIQTGGSGTNLGSTVDFYPTYSALMTEVCIITKSSNYGSIPNGGYFVVRDVNNSNNIIFNSSEYGVVTDNTPNVFWLCVDGLSIQVEKGNLYRIATYGDIGMGSYHFASSEDSWNYPQCNPITQCTNILTAKASFIKDVVELDTTGLAVSNDYLVRVRSKDDYFTNEYDESDAVFSIRTFTAPSNPVITYPNGGEEITSNPTITWTASTDTENDDIHYEVDYSDNDGLSYSSIDDNVSTNSLVWDISALSEDTDYRVRVRACDIYNCSDYDNSDDAFSILKNPLTPTIISPLSGTYSELEQSIELDIECSAIDPNGDNMTMQIWVDLVLQEEIQFNSNESVETSYVFTQEGNHRVGCKAFDGSEYSDTAEVTFDIDLPYSTSDFVGITTDFLGDGLIEIKDNVPLLMIAGLIVSIGAVVGVILLI